MLAWLEAVGVPGSLLVSRLSPTAPSGSGLRLLGKSYRGRLSVLQLSLSGLLRLRLQAEPAALLVLIHCSGVLEGSCGDRPLQSKPGGLVGCLFPHERLDLACFTPATQLYWLYLPHPLLNLVAELYGKQPLLPPLIVEVLRGFELALVPILEAFVHAPLAASEGGHALALQQLEVAVLSTLVRLMPDAEAAPGPIAQPAAVPQPYGDLCERAEQVMRQHLQTSFDLAFLAAACRCSKRTLQLAFRTKHNCTPMQHLRQLRLPCRTSLQYVEHFDETPSVTALNARSAQR